MSHPKPDWIRALSLHEALPGGPFDPAAAAEWPDDVDEGVHARSRFRSLTKPDRFAVYTIREAARQHSLDALPAWSGGIDHTLIVVREFRRVPLRASALGLLLLTAQPGYGARVVATLAHFVERAVSVYQPAYVLLAQSLEHPWTSALLMGVHEGSALQEAGAAAFSIDRLLPEVASLLLCDPEWFAYCPSREVSTLTHLVSRNAV